MSSKIESTNTKVDKALVLVTDTNAALEELETRVAASEEVLQDKLEKAEVRIQTGFRNEVKNLVQEQLRAAGFDPDLTASAMTTIQNSTNTGTLNYAGAVSLPPTQPQQAPPKDTRTREERQTDKFWDCRKSLRLWPVPGASRSALRRFLAEKLGLDQEFLDEDMGETTIKRIVERRPRYKDEVVVTFENKHVRDVVKAAAPNLANHAEAGMRLHIPDHLQKTFQALMAVTYDLKKRNPDLKRSVKFDEDDLSLHVDVQTVRDGEWRRIKPDQAFKATKGRKRSQSTSGPPADLKDDELSSLLDGSQE